MSATTDVEAIKSAIDAQFASPRAVEIDQAGKRSTDHVLVFLSRRYVDGFLLSGEASVQGSRLITRYVGKSVANVRSMQERTRSALEDKILSGEVGPFSFEAEQEPLAYDTDAGGWFTSADAWTA